MSPRKAEWWEPQLLRILKDVRTVFLLMLLAVVLFCTLLALIEWIM